MAKLKPYTKYKDSNSNWLDSVPIDWNVQPLISIGRIKKVIGQTNRELLSVYLNKGVIRFTDVDEKRTNVTSKDLSKYQSVDEGDFVLNNQQAWRGSVGVSSYKGIVSPAYLIIKLDSILDPEFANYMFRDKSLVSQFLIYSKGVGSIQRNLYWNDLKRVDLYIPPKDTQKAIANYLNTKSKEIDKYVKKLKKEIALLKEHRQKVISQAVTCGLDENGKLRKKPEWNEGNPIPQGWKDSGVEWLGLIPDGWVIRKLKYISKINREALPESTSAEFNIDYVDISSVNRTKGIIKTEAFQFSKAPSRARRIVHDGDVIVSTVRTYLKAIAGIENPPPNLIVSTGFAVLTPDFRQINSRYFKYSLIGDYFVDNVVRNSVGVSYPAINTTRLGNIIVIFPNLKNQIAISKYLDEHLELIDKQVEEIENQIEIIKEYKQSLISKVVTGKIDVRNINNNLSED